jgi:hypothetical protein
MKPALRRSVAPVAMTLRLLLAGGLMAPTGLASAQLVDGSRAFTFPENDNKLIALQRAGGDRPSLGPSRSSSMATTPSRSPRRWG